jgi:uncharacterized protein
MTVQTLRLDLRLAGCSTLREKRKQLQAIVVRLHRHFNVSVAESDAEGGADRAMLVAAAVGRTRRESRETLERVADAVSAHPRIELLGHEIDEV